MPEYLALTIGPIYKTLKNVKSSKGIWAASYMFSYLMKKICEGIVSSIGERNFLMPCIEFQTDGKINWSLLEPGVGLLSDRLILEAQPNDFNKMDKIIEKVINDFSSGFYDSLGNQIPKRIYEKNPYTLPPIPNEINKFLSSYLQCYFVQLKIKDDNPIAVIQNYLDNLELQNQYISVEEFPFLYDFFERCYYNTLVKSEFGEINFPSTIEIAAAQFRKEQQVEFDRLVKLTLDRTDDAESQEKFIKKLKNLAGQSAKKFKQHQKYITVVQADGDNVGHFIKTIFDTIPDLHKASEKFRQFNSHLQTFSRMAVRLIKAYRGTNIYAGGDDLLFFAPVMIEGGIEIGVNDIIGNTDDLLKIKTQDISRLFYDQPNGKSIFWLTDILDKLFDLLIVNNDHFIDIVKACLAAGKSPSLSYGISISYYKYPLNEALQQGINLLFHTAKKTEHKNALSFSVMKHSGQMFGTTLYKLSKTYQSFKQMLNEIPGNEEDNFLTSVMYKLDSQKKVLAYAAQNDNWEETGADGKSYEKGRLYEFFSNNFNEEGHLGHKDGFLKQVRHLVQNNFSDAHLALSDDNGIDTNIQGLYGCLRFIHFLMAEDHE